jgi:predicted amidohydrolase
MKIGLAAVDMNIVSKEQRRNDIAAFLDESAAAGCRMIFFPEYVNCQRTAEAVADWDAGHDRECFAMHGEPVPDGPVAGLIHARCARHGIWCGYGINEKRPHWTIYNSYILADPTGRIAGRHIKTHLPPCEEGITAADELQLIDSPLGKLGVLTCWEIQYPELTRMYQILGADMLVYPTVQYEPFALTVARVRAYDANRPMLAITFVWPDRPEPVRSFGAAHIDEHGNVLAQAEDRRHLLVVEVTAREGCDDERFARRRPEVYRRIVEE